MATGMQSILNGLPGPGSHSAAEMRDRNDDLPRTSPSKRFEALLGSAESREAGKGQDRGTVRQRPERPVSHSRATTRSNHATSTEKEAPASATTEHEPATSRSERTKEQAPEASDDRPDDKTDSKSHAKSRETAAVPSDLLLAGMFPQNAQAAGQTNPPTDSRPNDADVAAGEVTSATTAVPFSPGSTGEVPAQAASTLPSIPTQGQSASDRGAHAAADHAAATIQTADVSPREGGKIDVPLSPHMQNQETSGETVTGLTDGQAEHATMEADRMKAAAAMAMQAGENKPSPAAAADQIEVPPALDPAMQTGRFFDDSGAWNSEQFSGKDSRQFSDSSGGVDHSNLNPVQTDDSALRSQFIDRLTGVGQHSPPSNDSASGRSDTETVPIVRAAESERLTELRGTSPFAQTVTLDLDPLDMGPLRVRVMMTDQTVHAHFRTEHGELGQGLLQQGPSLESSLRTTGLEMGMLRVTVDQQQGRGDNAWAFQQQQGRPSPASGQPSTPGEEERAARMDNGYHNSGRVSFFA